MPDSPQSDKLLYLCLGTIRKHEPRSSTSPRLLRPRSYSLQFRILYFVLYWRLTRLDFAATTTLPP